MAEQETRFIGRGLVIGLVLVSALSLLAFLVLSAYAPDLRSEQSGGGNALSKSAIGFSGLRVLLESDRIVVDISRNPAGSDDSSLVVLTPEVFSNADEIKRLATPGPRLIVLPKWVVVGEQFHPGWVRQVRTLDPEAVKHVLSTLAKDARVAADKGKTTTGLHGEYPRFAEVVPGRSVKLENLQTISGKSLEPDIVDDKGRAVVAQLRGTQIYVLSDPDLLNNRGIHDRATAHLALALLDRLRVGDQKLTFDVTLNGFRRSPDLFRAAFSPPFLGATLCAILAAAFIAFHALSRFGSPKERERVFAFGKRALADNTAAVIHLMRREPGMAPRYAQAMLNIVASQTSARERAGDPAWIATIEKRDPGTARFAELRAEAALVRDIGGLMRVAQKLYRWRREILHERQ